MNPSDEEVYDEYAAAFLQEGKSSVLPSVENLPTWHQVPYAAFRSRIERLATRAETTLELAAGIGLLSHYIGIKAPTSVIFDISKNSLRVNMRANEAPLLSVCGDMSSLPFKNQSFDLIFCAGGMSYVDASDLSLELQRVIRPGGVVVVVDSLNHNPVYKFNRFIQRVRGRRSATTVSRMPTLTTVSAVFQNAESFEIEFFGVLTFLAPVVARLFGEKVATNFAHRLDRNDRSKKFAFKFVASGIFP
jgi:ubiquinone/menaquinone biosynthesis C-methylase UbiE